MCSCPKSLKVGNEGKVETAKETQSGALSKERNESERLAGDSRAHVVGALEVFQDGPLPVFDRGDPKDTRKKIL